jgi:uncharacterized protein (TIGR02001 family)
MILAAALATSALPSLAQTVAAAPEPEYSITGNLGLFSDYRFRGISQTNKNAAIQGGFDFAMKNGFYLGNWNSNIDSAGFAGSNIEMDFYGGYKATFGEFGVDVGVIYYYYPGSEPTVDNTEIYVGGSWGPIAVKYYYAVSDFFSLPDSKGSNYIILSASHDFGGGFGINGSIGYQSLKGGAAITQINGSVVSDITDYKIGGTYDLDGWIFGLSYVTTNRDIAGWTSPQKNISNGTGVLSVSKSF